MLAIIHSSSVRMTRTQTLLAGAEITPADLTALDQCIDGVATAFSDAKKALGSPGMGLGS